jgi:ADP-heptose:LPS heptosyltransferase
MPKVVAIRLSSMGDVLLTIPAIRAVLDTYPDLEIVMVTRKRFTEYFPYDDRLIILPFEPDGRHRGLVGLLRLYGDIRKHRFATLIDLHNVLRTWILDILFFLTFRKVVVIPKYRRLRRLILRRRTRGTPLPHVVSRYRSTFERAGWKTEIRPFVFKQQDNQPLKSAGSHDAPKIGFAPLSRHSTKNWGLKPTRELIALLRERGPVEIHLFGGPEDREKLNGLAGGPVHCHAGILSPMEEIDLISTLNLFVSMDSANMHLAALSGIPVVSVWGATDPDLGFAPLYQPFENAIFADPFIVTCRPCSVFGEKPCHREDAPMICMESIRPAQVMKKIEEILHYTTEI